LLPQHLQILQLVQLFLFHHLFHFLAYCSLIIFLQFILLPYCLIILLQKLHILFEQSVALHNFSPCLCPLLLHQFSLLLLFLNQSLPLQFLCQRMAKSVIYYILLINATFLSLKVKKYFSCSLITVYWMFFCLLYNAFKKYWSKPDFLSLS
jgi:hypothetical protein